VAAIAASKQDSVKKGFTWTTRNKAATCSKEKQTCVLPPKASSHNQCSQKQGSFWIVTALCCHLWENVVVKNKNMVDK